MNGPEHYRKGEELLALAETVPSNNDETNPAATLLTAQATTHFLAAQAAAQAAILTDRYVGDGPHISDWLNAINWIVTAEIVDEDEPTERRKPHTRITWEHLEAVARVYIRAAMKGEPPTRAVANHFEVPHSTAAKWVGHARKRGAMPPAETEGDQS